MSAIPSPPTAAVLDPTFPWPQVELIETDGEPLETDWHRVEINLLIESVHSHLAPRRDYYAGGNMFIYYSVEQARDRDYRGPDFFFVADVSAEPMRPYWAVWEEGGRYPDVIIELLSPTTAKEDRTTKKRLYERVFQTAEYYCYDPEVLHLEGWRLNARRRYAALRPNAHGRLWCERLGLWLGVWEGPHLNRRMPWLRFFTSDGNVVPLFAEAERQRAEVERQRAEVERQRAEAEGQRAEAEGQRAEAEGQRADAERQRADALAEEVARLKAELAAKRKRRKP